MSDKKEKVLYPNGIYRTAVLDTVNALQNNLYMDMVKGRKGSFDAWRDFGIEIYDLYDWIKSLPEVVLVQVLGVEGTGKTVGGKHLDPSTNVWLNADAKPLSFFGAKGMYPPDNSKRNYKVVRDYEETKAAIASIHAKRKGTLIVFILGHIETYNIPEGGQGQRLKVLGKQATKLGIEGVNLTHTYYTKVDALLPVTDTNRYKLSTFNSGYNTVRAPEGYWEGDIPNNYQIIVDRILEDHGELV
jgi:hypothetical protein